MKALLVNPPRSPHNAILEHASAASRRYIHRKLIGPPLGLLTVAAALSDHEVALLEMKGEIDLHENAGKAPPDTGAILDAWLAKVDPDLVGATFIASEFNAGIDILRRAKAFNRRIVTVAGGLHATLCPEQFPADAVDVVCPGQATAKIRGIAAALEGRGRLEDVPGILLHRDGRWIPTGTEEPVDGAGRDFLVPRRSLVDPWLSTYRVGQSPGPATYLFSSLGCPYRCTFCSIWPGYGGSYFRRDIESIVDELKQLEAYPTVRFADANSLIESDFLEALFDRIAAEGIEKFFIMDMRVDAIVRNPRLIEKLARGGLKVVISGFESFRSAELARYNKGSESRLIEEAIGIFHRNGIQIRGNYVIPPDYGEDDFKALAEYAGRHRVAFAGYTILTPMPGTALFQEMQDRITDRNLDKYNFFNCVLATALPVDEFLTRVADLWAVRAGDAVI